MRSILVGLVLGSIFVSAVASAEAPVPRYGQLPAGTPTFMPKKAPPRSLPRSTVPGIVVRQPEQGQPDIVEVSSTGRDLGHPPTPEETRTCLSTATGSALEMERKEPERESEWGDAGFSAEAPVYRRTKDFTEGGVTAVHTERFEERSGSPVLEILDAWVDPVTHGARVFARKTLPLVLVGASAYGVRVFAMRDDRAKERLVQFVLVPDAKHREDGAGILGVSSDVHMMARSQCGHLRLAVPVTDEGGSAQLFTTVVVSETKLEPTTGAPAEHHRTAGGDADRRFRTLAAQVSVSKTARDPEPVLSVSFGWSTRETRDREF